MHWLDIGNGTNIIFATIYGKGVSVVAASAQWQLLATVDLRKNEARALGKMGGTVCARQIVAQLSPSGDAASAPETCQSFAGL